MTGETTSLDQILALKRGETGPIVNVDEPLVKLVIFTLDGSWFAFAGEAIREVLPDSPVFYLPGCPESLEGVINVRGDIESVIDLRQVLGFLPAADKARSRILLGRAAAMHSGIRVDAVEEVMDVPQSSIQAPPHTIPDHRKAIVRGIVRFKGELVTLLDLERLFADYAAGLR